jgi:signal transduction histidine kinase/DNA-binding response OmpR family regulator
MGMARLGGVFRLLAGLTVIAGLAAVTGVVAMSLFASLSQGYADLTGTRLPVLAAASQLSRQAGTVGADGPILAAADSPAAREAAMTRMAGDMAALNSAIATLEAPALQVPALQIYGVDAADPEALKRLSGVLSDTLRVLDGQVQARLETIADSAALTGRLVDLATRIRTAAMEAGEGDTGPTAATAAAGAAVRRWSGLTDTAVVLALAATRADGQARLDQLRLDFRDTLERAATALARLSPAATRRVEPLYRELSVLGLGERNPFAARAGEMAMGAAIGRTLERHGAVAGQLTAAATATADAIQRDIARRDAAALQAIGHGRQLLIVLAAASVLGALVILAVFNRRAPSPPTRLADPAPPQAQTAPGGNDSESRGDTHTSDIPAANDKEPAPPRFVQAPPRARDVAGLAARTRADFLATISHRIRTPMNGLDGVLELLACTPLAPEQKELLSTARDSATALTRFVGDVVDLSAIEAGQLVLDDMDFDPTELVEGAAGAASRTAEGRPLTVLCRVDVGIPARVRGDAVRLRQILDHLADNAVRFTARGRVIVRLTALPGGHADGVRLRFEVSDTGTGIASGLQAGLFQSIAGAGLGLSLCARLVELMGGRIGVESAPDHGSLFWFEVALGQGEARADSGPDLSGLSIVAADADPLQRSVIVRALEAAGADVAEATSGAEVVELAELSAPDILVLAGGLPDGGTADIVSRAAALAGRAPAVLQLVESAGEAVALPGMATDHAVRPLRRAALIRRVAALVGRTAPESPPEVPAAPAAAPSAPTAIPQAVTPAAAPAADSPILVAEDHPTNQQVILRQLHQLGYVAELAVDGVEALAAWGERPYRLLITDCHMPRLNGYELATRIREAERQAGDGRRIPIVALTANAMPGERDRCLAAGMDDYLSKPVTLRQIADMLERWSAQGQARRALETPVIAKAPPPAAGPALLDLDLDHVRATFGVVDSGTAGLLEYFLETTKPLFDTIATALATGDMEGARSAAHAAAGAARTAGAVRLAVACSALEVAAAAGDVPASRIHAATATAAMPALAAAIGVLARDAAGQAAP